MIQYINKLLLVISLSCAIVPKLYSQPELISNGGFEQFKCYDPNCMTTPVAICCEVSCNRGEFRDHVFYDSQCDCGWKILGNVPSTDQNEADLFDRRWTTPAPNTSCWAYTEKFGIPINYFTEDENTSIEHVGGASAGLRYAGLQGGPGLRNDGIAYKLPHPIKANTIYTLRFYAHNVGGGTPEIKVRLGPDNDWSDGVVHHAKDIDQSGWQLVEMDFFVFYCDIDWVMIRIEPPLNPFAKRRVLVDDFSMRETCKQTCSSTYGPLIDNVYSNNVHMTNNPLTFFNLDDVKDFKLEIFHINQTIPFRTISITNPASKVSWDGKDGNGNLVANAGYWYKVTLGNDCRCREFTGTFAKADDPRLFNVTGSNYLGGLMFYNLHNATRMRLIIKASDGSTVRDLEIINPQDRIVWDGKNGAGADVAFATYAWELEVSNICGTEYFLGSFNKVVDVDPNDPFLGQYLDYNPVPKPPVTCPFVYNYSSFSRPPQACCSAQPHLYIANLDIEGQWDYILLNSITAGPAVTIKAGSDVLFQAGYEIGLLPGFSVEPATIFDAVIDDCIPTQKTGAPGDGICLPGTQHINSSDAPAADVLVYPNPGEGQYVLELPSVESPLSVQITDMFGTVIREYSSISAGKLAIDITEKAPGIYFIKVLYPQGKMVLKKIIHR